MEEVRGEKALLPYLFARLFLGFCTLRTFGSSGGLMVSALDSGASGPGSSPGRGHCVVFLRKTLDSLSHSASLHSGVYTSYKTRSVP